MSKFHNIVILTGAGLSAESGLGTRPWRVDHHGVVTGKLAWCKRHAEEIARMCCALQHMEAHAYLATAGSSFAAARITLDGESLALRGTPTVALSGVEVSLPAGA